MILIDDFLSETAGEYGARYLFSGFQNPLTDYRIQKWRNFQISLQLRRNLSNPASLLRNRLRSSLSLLFRFQRSFFDLMNPARSPRIRPKWFKQSKIFCKKSQNWMASLEKPGADEEGLFDKLCGLWATHGFACIGNAVGVLQSPATPFLVTQIEMHFWRLWGHLPPPSGFVQSANQVCDFHALWSESLLSFVCYEMMLLPLSKAKTRRYSSNLDTNFVSKKFLLDTRECIMLGLA